MESRLKSSSSSVTRPSKGNLVWLENIHSWVTEVSMLPYILLKKMGWGYQPTVHPKSTACRRKLLGNEVEWMLYIPAYVTHALVHLFHSSIQLVWISGVTTPIFTLVLIYHGLVQFSRVSVRADHLKHSHLTFFSLTFAS